MNLQDAKRVVLEYYRALERSTETSIAEVLSKHTAEDYRWRGMHPFGELSGSDLVADMFWKPVLRAFSPVQRRPDVFLAGNNTVEAHGAETPSVWVCQMGHLLGLFDRSWLDIPPTGKMCFVPYVEFHRVEADQIAETTLFFDVISVMRQAGHYPLPPQTGSSHLHPGPLTHDGLLLNPQDPETGTATMDLVNRMIFNLDQANGLSNETGENRVPRSSLEEFWHDGMIWFGPEGIGATYTIDRYQQQHQYPFRFNLSNKQFHGHIARFAEGSYACFFGWANLTNTATGGFLGMTGNATRAEMRVVDVYRRDGDKLAENWVFIDLLHWLNMQGLDLLARMRQLNGEAL